MDHEIVEVNTYSLDELHKALSNGLVTRKEIEQHDIVRYIAAYLSHLSAATMVIEGDYVDRHYLVDYSRYYARCFPSYDRRCRRIHFFSEPFEKPEFLGCVLGTSRSLGSDETETLTAETLERSYLGFVVLRPLPTAIIGRTLLKPYNANGTTSTRYYTSLIDAEVNLFGLSLSLRTLPFQEQDNVLAVCATVAIWSALQSLSRRFENRILTPSEITDEASKWLHMGRLFPSRRGLTVREMCNVIRHTGLEPELFDEIEESSPVDVRALIYAYLRCDIPVVLNTTIGSDLHAVLIMGFALPINASVVQNENGISLFGSRVCKFYAHDDRKGPFTRLTAVESVVQETGLSKRTNRFVTKMLGKKQRVRTKIEFQGEWDELIKPDSVIVPVYHKMRLHYIDVLEIVNPIDNLLRYLGYHPEWDIYLTDVKPYRMSIRKDAGIPSHVKECVLLKPLPRYLWRCVVLDHDFETRVAERVFEILVDATDIIESVPVLTIQWYSIDEREAFLTQLRTERHDDTMAIVGERLWGKLADMAVP